MYAHNLRVKVLLRRDASRPQCEEIPRYLGRYIFRGDAGNDILRARSAKQYSNLGQSSSFVEIAGWELPVISQRAD
jgi:hypothetical protein